jgi:O-acetylserine/cysteine efflux transporter
MSYPHIVLAVFVTVLWGFTFVVMRDLLDVLPPFLMSTLRVVAAGAPVLVLWRVPKIPFYWVLLLGTTQGVVQMSLLLFGMQFGMPAGLASLVLQMQVLFTTLLAFMLLGEKPGRAQYAGIAISLVGMIVIASTMPGGGTLIGFGIVILAALTWATSNIVVKFAGTDDVISLVAWAHVIGILPLLALSYGLEGQNEIFHILAELSWFRVGEIAFLGGISTFGGFTLWSYLMRKNSASTVAPFSLIIPIAGMTSTALILGEELSTLRMVGAGLVLVGLAFGTIRLGAAKSRAAR